MRQTLAIGLLLISVSAYGQDAYGPKGPVVSMAPAPVVTVKQGKSATVPLSFRVSSGYHINSHHPKSEFLIPTILKVDAITDIVISKTIYPEGRDMSFAFAPDEKLSVYAGDFQVDVRVRPLRTVHVGKYIVRGTLKYQACDNAQCYPPKQLPVSFDVKIAKGPRPPGKNPAQSPHAHR
ncbi:MAG TPA: protein-disulfide reductase DsbD domain-containing protein [Terriglobales bacterium]|nr:protein-disulfide reductase DsbD domain-containing protein [Terriglobales bacterium]